MLVVEKLNQFYGQSHILHNISFTVPEKQCTCIIGRNGVGKTTLLKSIMGQVAIKADELSYNQQDLLATKAEKRAYQGIAYVPQGRQIFPLLTVEENLKIGLPVHNYREKTRSNKVPDFIYQLFPVLYKMKHRRGGDLSGGQQQQLAIGRALVMSPSLLILDEPTEGIQPNIVDDITKVIRQLNREWGLTVLIVEQKLHLINSLADHFVLIERGRCVAKGTGQQLTPELINTYLSV
ncbi:urea ABC transporter ATP-binding subunit UrtE [Gallibacterium salpingitidis]|uniref:Urea ABC transporter ATP-binding protein n=1 Tax=Gallibacterium salpingitidis TaxID=505341 RepID=A0A1A7NXH7_9PAST|nr:urea ABC transporter ATP-binding subunit UrtE [Gallibacterium salpingitidis]OBW94290.1 urea ABC transporter ATP-binding protein [Gallibacterium salpingitidis]